MFVTFKRQDKNANKNRTTSDLFGKRLHSYLIKDAINDHNVLGFCVDYVGTYKSRVKTEIIGIKRDFDIGSKPRGFSYSFGESRSKFGKVCTPGNNIIDINIPGPGKYYSNINTLGNMGSPKYTMRPKCIENNKNRTIGYPGPGAYEPVVKINPKGKYPISRCINTKGRNFGIDGINRFNNYRCKYI